MLSFRNLLTILRFLLLTSVAILACLEPAIAETTHPSPGELTDQQYSKALTKIASLGTASLEERVIPARTEPLKGWAVRLFTTLWREVRGMKLGRRRLPLNLADQKKAVANQLYVECGVNRVTEDLFESNAFESWSDGIKQIFAHKKFKENARVMVEVLVEHNEDLLFSSIAEAKKTTGFTATVKELESALLNKCVNDMGTDKRLIDLYKNTLIQKWYDCSRESAIVQIQRKVNANPGLRLQVDSTVVEAETSADGVMNIAKDVKTIFKAERALAAKAHASDSDIVTSKNLNLWLAALAENNGLDPMQVLMARLKASSHMELLALCWSKTSTPENVLTDLRKAVFVNMKDLPIARVTKLLDLELVNSPQKMELSNQILKFWQEQQTLR